MRSDSGILNAAVGTMDTNTNTSTNTDTGNRIINTEATNSKATNGRRQRRRKKKMKNDKNGNDASTNAEEEGSDSGGNRRPNKGNQQPKKRNNRNRGRHKYPWRKHIPAGTVDPITLESLASLPYPPFALRAAAPYLPVPEWPPKEGGSQNGNVNRKELETKEERERRLLQEQWGNTPVLSKESDAPPLHQEAVNPNHLNLFDGRALAYYMVSQLQFIDPLNRRDLTRDELCHLDRYLRRNNFTDLNVVEAYDTKGVSLSTAGAASTTAAGRMEILQQEARLLLGALFGGNQSALPAATNENPRSLMHQYSNYQALQEQHSRQANQQNGSGGSFLSSEDAGLGMGIYGDQNDGIVVIDDDLNPNLRGTSQGLGPYYAAQPARAGRNASSLQLQNFPALSTAATVPPEQSPFDYVAAGTTETTSPPPQLTAQKKALPAAKSLKFITKAVRKTKPEEAQRQFEAREKARMKAALSHLTTGSEMVKLSGADMPKVPSSLPPLSMEQMERNRRLADALGLTGSTPNTVKTTFGSNIVLYPDELILKARDMIGPLLKLERKWKAFLEDDRAFSLPLNHMNRETRGLVHEYAVFWKLQTESFDPEPRRYVHCVKRPDTQQPCPLLYDAVRQWRGPTGRTASSMLEHSWRQTAGQDTPTIDLLRAGEPCLPRNPRAAALLSVLGKLEEKEGALPSSRFPALAPARDPVEVESDEHLRRRARMEERKRREEEKKERKQRVLEAAFASDDEGAGREKANSDSDWDEGDALYPSSDDEGAV